jgi:DNA-binding NarL/FixJ family response regulator
VLTPREQEVAALIAEGMSNRQIAARLHLSERTVENHVAHILTKLAFDSRARVAAWWVSR